MTAHTILIDGNNFGFAGMANPKLSAGDRDTQSIFTVIRRIRNIVEDHPASNVIVIWDGRSWRKDFYKEYKANREKTEKDVEARESYYEQQKEIRKGLQLLGIRQIWATNLEADDIAATLCHGIVKSGGSVTLMTADKDWQQLITSPYVIWQDVINHRLCTYSTFEKTTGFKNPRQFIEAKCILGDKSDNIKGIYGVGPKSLEVIYKITPFFESFLAYLEMDPTAAETAYRNHNGGRAMLKSVRYLDIEEARETLKLNTILVDLLTEERPKAAKTVDEKGKLDIEGFTEFCYKNAFHSITRDMDRFVKPLKENPFVTR